MAGLLDPRNGDGTWVENRPSKASQLWGIAEPYVMGPWNAWKGLMDADLDTLLYDTGPKGQQAVENAFNVAGTVTGGSSVVPKPDDALNMGIKAFHGSPHDFDRFSLDKIGTGEGAQAYGHGLYFAENEGVAKGYRDQLSYHNKTLDGKKFYGSESHAHSLLSDAMDAGGSVDEALIAAKSQLADFSAGPNKSFSRAKIAREAVTALEDWKARGAASMNPGSMYEVEINADPEQFLDWDKPLSADTPKAMRDAFNSVANSDPALREQFHQAFRENQPGSIYYSILNDRAKTGDLVKNQTYATERLREAGIPGIKYLDAGSRSAGDGTRNYVVFDDNLINIIRKYGIAGLLGGSAAMNAMTAEPREQY